MSIILATNAETFRASGPRVSFCPLHVGQSEDLGDAHVSEEVADDADEHEAPRPLEVVSQPAREAESEEEPADLRGETWRQLSSMQSWTERCTSCCCVVVHLFVL